MNNSDDVEILDFDDDIIGATNNFKLSSENVQNGSKNNLTAQQNISSNINYGNVNEMIDKVVNTHLATTGQVKQGVYYSNIGITGLRRK